MSKLIHPALVRADLRNVLRDSTMVMVLFGPVALFALLGFLPLIEALLLSELQFDLFPYRPPLVTFLGLIPGLLFAMIYGFIVLDERDEQIVEVMSVTPLRKEGYLRYKLLIPMLLSFLGPPIIQFSFSLLSLSMTALLPISFMAGLEAGLGVLFLVSFSSNKVEGMAFGKLLGIFYLVIPAVFLWDSPLHWIGCISPPFWIAKASQAALAQDPLVWLHVTLGLAMHLVLLKWMLRKFEES